MGSFASDILHIERRRSLHWLGLDGWVTDGQQDLFGEIALMECAITYVALDIPVADRAPGAVAGTLDAIHLGTAQAIQDELAARMTFFTHDRQQAAGAWILGLSVVVA